MKTELKIKLLLYFFQPNNNQGFTQLGLLVRLFLYGTAVTALSFPLYTWHVYPHSPCRDPHLWFDLRDINCDKQAEGKQYPSAVNKAQQAYYTENGQFLTTSDTAAAFASLGVGIKTQTSYYTYRIGCDPRFLGHGPFQKKDGQAIVPDKPIKCDDYVMVTAEALGTARKSYVGIVALVGKSDQDQTSQSMVCEADSPGFVTPVMPPRSPEKDIQCPESFEIVK